jgi:hypothetical protein
VRVQLPSRISLSKTLVFAAALFCVQQFEHTNFLFSVLFFGFLMLSVIAFNEGGGFTRAGGAYVFFFSLLVVDVGVFWKAVLGEPADSNLLVPQLDMLCYTVCMFMLLVVIYTAKKIFGRPYGIAPTEADYSLAARGALVLGFVQTGLNLTGIGGSGSVLSMINQLGQFFPLAIMLGTITAIRESGGRRTINFTNGCAMAVSFAVGITTFSKQAMFTPVVCWALGVLYARLNLRLIHYVAVVCFALFALRVAPLVAEGRNVAAGGTGVLDRGEVVLSILLNLKTAKMQEEETVKHEVETLGKSGYYNESQGFIARLSMISVDDAFLNYAEKGNRIGYEPVIENYENLLPHFILPDKPVPPGGNFYAHKMGGFLAPDDETTGISFSPVPEAYYVDGWRGLFLLLPAIWFSIFASIDYICGDFRRTPWGLVVVVIFAHLAPESLIGGLVWISGYGNLGLVVTIFACTELVPVVGALFYGSARDTVSAFVPQLVSRRRPSSGPTASPKPLNL